MYKGFWVDRVVIDADPHFAQGCSFCHKGDETAKDQKTAHNSMIKRPSDDLNTCKVCHEKIANNYNFSLHYTSAGQRHGVGERFSESELKTFDNKVFEQSCRSCHASCGDCHVKGPAIGGISAGLLKGHRFVKRDESKTCALCHGGRVYPEFTGKLGGKPDVHYEKGMSCNDCHEKAEFHGDGNAYQSRREVKGRPACSNCHPAGQEKNAKAKSTHTLHAEKVSCSSCHTSGEYQNCYGCHQGKVAASKPGLILGLNPHDKKTVTTLRLIPTVKGTFRHVGNKMENFDRLPNYWDAVPHNIQKQTERTQSCDVCHVEKKGFLTRENMLKNGSKANDGLIYTPKSIKK